jgi:hypothetical protein
MTPVDRKASHVVVSTKIPKDWGHLLEAVVERRQETFKSQTIRSLIRDELEAHFPGSTEEAA